MSEEGYRRAHPVDDFWFNERADAMSEHEAKSDFWLRQFPTFRRARGTAKSFALWVGSDDAAFMLLRQINLDREARCSAAKRGETNYYWLLRHRDRFRKIIASGRVGPIKIYLRRCPEEMVPIALWLWGECADRFRVQAFAELGLSPSPRIRKTVAKALCRLEAWPQLDRMARLFPDDAKVQWFAKAVKVRRSFSERLRNYARDVDDSHADEVVTPSRMPYWAREREWEYTPPKSRELIRRLLRRIRHRVRWGAT